MNAIEEMRYLNILDQIQEEQRLIESAYAYEYKVVINRVNGASSREIMSEVATEIYTNTKSAIAFIISQIEKLVTFIKKSIAIVRAKMKKFFAGNIKKVRDKVASSLKTNNLEFKYTGAGLVMDAAKTDLFNSQYAKNRADIMKDIEGNMSNNLGAYMDDEVSFDEIGDPNSYVLSTVYGDDCKELSDIKKKYEKSIFTDCNDLTFTNDIINKYVKYYDAFSGLIEAYTKIQYKEIDSLNKLKAILRKYSSITKIDTEASLHKMLSQYKTMVQALSRTSMYESSITLSMYTKCMNICNTIFKLAIKADPVVNKNDVDADVDDDIDVES